MIRISQIRLNPYQDESDLRKKVTQILHIPDNALYKCVIRKKSVDARRKGEAFFVYTVDVSTDRDDLILRHNTKKNVSRAHDAVYRYPVQGNAVMNGRPVIIGSGPAGLFAAYFLAINGYRPILIERGSEVRQRIKDVEKFWRTLELDPQSNIQFGEGGAGTFSDGKLNTGVNDPYGRNRLVLETFVENGAPEEILYIAKPHLGTDILTDIVENMRNRILDCCGEVYFNTCFTSFILKEGKAAGIRTADGREFFSENIILATGHSARDTFKYIIHDTDLKVTAKPFAVGVRAEHSQKDINSAQYGADMSGVLPPADYKLTYRASSGRSVYSFCMCPGGYVVNSSSMPGAVCINGMSYSARDSENANSAIVAAVSPGSTPEDNIRFQQELEEKTFALGKGAIVSQLFADFESGNVSTGFGSIHPVHKGCTVMGNIRDILPSEVCDDICEAIHAFGRKIKGFDDPCVIISAVESRTSSPVRISRNSQMESDIKGIFPVGEGAGYAGGIMSAAMDGIKVFEVLYSRYANFTVT